MEGARGRRGGGVTIEKLKVQRAFPDDSVPLLSRQQYTSSPWRHIVTTDWCAFIPDEASPPCLLPEGTSAQQRAAAVQYHQVEALETA